MRIATLLFAILVAALSCTKTGDSDSGNPPTPPGNPPSDTSVSQCNLELFADKKWRMIAFSRNVNGDLGPERYEESFPFAEEHMNDDYTIFYRDSTYEFNEDEIKPFYDSTQVYRGKWWMTDNDKQLNMRIDGASEPDAYRILGLDSLYMKVAYSNQTTRDTVQYKIVQ